jgi:hypothetical protein
MSASKTPIFRGASNEAACMSVMHSLKVKGEWLEALQDQTNMNLRALEAVILMQRDNTLLQKLYIRMLVNLKRHKCVASWQEESSTKAGHWEKQTLSWPYDMNRFEVEVNEKSVRVIVKKEEHENLEKEAILRAKANKMKDLKFW